MTIDPAGDHPIGEVAPSSASVPGHALVGLTSADAAARLDKVGPNEVREAREPAWLGFARRLWGPLPWMLEGTIALSLVLRHFADASVIGFLLVFNTVVAVVQQQRASGALALLRRRLAVNARVLRDEQWSLVPARELVPGDVVHVRVGDLVPADLRLVDGAVQLDVSALTGESVPVDAAGDADAPSGAVVQRGEATGEVTATGSRSFAGRTARLVDEARTQTHLESIVLSVVRALVAIDVLLVLALVGYAAWVHSPFAEVGPFALIVLVASVPVALPATFTLAQALGSLELAHAGEDGHGVLVTRLSAVQEAASMDVLCTDKTGTITANRLVLSDTYPIEPWSRDELLRLAGFASDEAGQDPIDLAILEAASHVTAPDIADSAQRLQFVPFDPSTKRTEAVVRRGGEDVRVVKGMPEVVAALLAEPPGLMSQIVERLGGRGERVLAVAAGPADRLALIGLVGLADPPRPDSADLVSELHSLGIEVKMVTGDGTTTALAVAQEVGIGSRVAERDEIRLHPERAETSDVLAGAFPEDKLDLVRNLQRAGHVVGMTGDGVNDAPALKQAEVGIAVANATDVAKAAASLVLTDAGLRNVVEAVTASRRIYQRMMTWTLNKIVKTLQVMFFLCLAFFVTGTFVTTPLLVVLLLFTNDFVTMSLATDHVRPSLRPDRWRIGALVAAASPLAFVAVLEAFGVLYLARNVFGLSAPQVQTTVFVMLVFSGQATVYVIRERKRFWSSRPSTALLIATAADLIVVILFAATGVLMTAIPVGVIASVFGIATASMFIMDPVKIFVFRRAGLG